MFGKMVRATRQGARAGLYLLSAVLLITAIATYLYGRRTGAGKVPAGDREEVLATETAGSEPVRGRRRRQQEPVMAEHRSRQWYAGDDLRNNYLHRAWMRRGRARSRLRRAAADRHREHRVGPDAVQHHLDEVATSVKQGVYEAGGIPLNLPVMSLGETQMRPTAMLLRNLAAMAIEEMLRANPVDGVVLLGGCDKTIPALLMAAASVDLPALVVPGGRCSPATSEADRWAAVPTCGAS